jgi:hypothetical protein
MARGVVNDARSVFLENIASISRCVGWGVHYNVVNRTAVPVGFPGRVDAYSGVRLRSL